MKALIAEAFTRVVCIDCDCWLNRLSAAEGRPELSVLLTFKNHLRLPSGTSVDKACLVNIRSQMDNKALASATVLSAWKLALLRTALLAVKLKFLVHAEKHAGCFESIACNCMREVADRIQTCSDWFLEAPIQPNDCLLCHFIVQMLPAIIQKMPTLD